MNGKFLKLFPKALIGTKGFFFFSFHTNLPLWRKNIITSQGRLVMFYLMLL